MKECRIHLKYFSYFKDYDFIALKLFLIRNNTIICNFISINNKKISIYIMVVKYLAFSRLNKIFDYKKISGHYFAIKTLLNLYIVR